MSHKNGTVEEHEEEIPSKKVNYFNTSVEPPYIYIIYCIYHQYFR